MLTYIKKLKPGSTKPSSPTTETSPPPPPLTISPATANQHVSEEEKSPVLSPADETFLENALKDTDDDGPNVIFPGFESTSTMGTVTPTEAAVMPAVEEAAKEAEKEAKKEGEWKDALTTRWQGLRRTVSEAAEKRHRKPKSPDKGKGKGKEKEEEVVEAIPEEEAAAAEVETKTEKKEKQKEKGKKKDKGKKKKNKEFVREEDELSAALDQLNLAAEDVSFPDVTVPAGT
jgi:hypothetical protein